MKYLIGLALILISIGSVQAKTKSAGVSQYVFLNGTITKLNIADSSEVPAAGVPIEIWANDNLVATVLTGPKGRYNYKLPFFSRYTIKYGSVPFVKKMIEIDASDFAKRSRKHGFEMNIDVALFEDKGYAGLDFLRVTPIAKAEYSRRLNSVKWDRDHTEKVNSRIKIAIASFTNNTTEKRLAID
jgi:hypothetical protein